MPFEIKAGVKWDGELKMWVVSVRDVEDKVLSVKYFELKHEAEKYLDTYAYMFAQIGMDRGASR